MSETTKVEQGTFTATIYAGKIETMWKVNDRSLPGASYHGLILNGWRQVDCIVDPNTKDSTTITYTLECVIEQPEEPTLAERIREYELEFGVRQHRQDILAIADGVQALEDEVTRLRAENARLRGGDGEPSVRVSEAWVHVPHGSDSSGG